MSSSLWNVKAESLLFLIYFFWNISSHERTFQNQLTLVASIILEISARKLVKTVLQEIFQFYLDKKQYLDSLFDSVSISICFRISKKIFVNATFQREGMYPRDPVWKADSQTVNHGEWLATFSLHILMSTEGILHKYDKDSGYKLMNIGVLVLSEQQLVRWLPVKGFSSYILAFADQGITSQHLPVSA